MDDKQDTRVRERSGFLPIVVGFLAGAVSATAAALLLAPVSGQDTRAQIGGAYRRSTEKLGRLPAALKSAGLAAQAAFAEARAEEHSAEQHVSVTSHEAAPARTNNH